MATRSQTADLDPQMCADALEACACLSIRKGSRIVTQLYDEALQPSGLRSTQLVILLAIQADDRPTVAQLARQLMMDPSTLNRNLQPLTKKRLVRNIRSRDGRRRMLELSQKGCKVVLDAVPLWKKAQSRFAEQLGSERSHDLLESLRAFTSAARSG